LSSILKQSGVYTITCVPTGKVYVGSAARMFRDRFKSHRHLLRGGRHHSNHLQRAWNKHGEDAFAFAPLLICRPEDVIFYEQRAIDTLRPAFNRAPTAGSCRGFIHDEQFRKQCVVRNKAAAKRYLVHGDLLTAHEIAERYGLNLSATVRRRLRRGVRGDALAMPAREKHEVHGEHLTVLEIAKKYGLPKAAVCQRLARGLVGEDLITPTVVKHLVQGELLTTGEIAKKYGLDRTTVVYRVRHGLQGDALAEAPHSGVSYDRN
jgi:group I intron endonuclease